MQLLNIPCFNSTIESGDVELFHHVKWSHGSCRTLQMPRVLAALDQNRSTREEKKAEVNGEKEEEDEEEEEQPKRDEFVQNPEEIRRLREQRRGAMYSGARPRRHDVIGESLMQIKLLLCKYPYCLSIHMIRDCMVVLHLT